MTKPVFENDQCGGRWPEDKEAEDGKVGCGLISAGLKEAPFLPPTSPPQEMTAGRVNQTW